MIAKPKALRSCLVGTFIPVGKPGHRSAVKCRVGLRDTVTVEDGVQSDGGRGDGSLPEKTGGWKSIAEVTFEEKELSLRSEQEQEERARDEWGSATSRPPGKE